MADLGTFASDSEILLRCGKNVSADVSAAGWFDTIIIDVEGVISALCRFDWKTADVATSINASVRGILTDTCACLAAIEGITYDMSGYSSRIEAEDMINVLRDIALRNMSILRDKKVQDFMVAA